MSLLSLYVEGGVAEFQPVHGPNKHINSGVFQELIGIVDTVRDSCRQFIIFAEVGVCEMDQTDEVDKYGFECASHVRCHITI